MISLLFIIGAILCFARSVRNFRKAVEAEAGSHFQAGNWLRISGILSAGAGMVLLGLGFVIWWVT